MTENENEDIVGNGLENMRVLGTRWKSTYF